MSKSRVNTEVTAQAKPASPRAPAASGLLQRGPASHLEDSPPQIVGEVLRSPGQPLDAATRGAMESRFGYNFGQVRVHNPQTHDLQTHNPQTPEQDRMTIGPPDDLYEREAHHMADRIMSVSPAETAHSARPHPGYDFSQVRIHQDSQAAESARAVKAQAYTVGHHIIFNAGKYDPHTSAGGRLLAHELTHVLQQSSALSPGGAGQSAIATSPPLRLQRVPTELSTVPARERGAIQASRIEVQVPPETVSEYFTIVQSTGRPSSLSIGATNSFGAGIPAALQSGLGSIGAWLNGNSNALPLNSTINVDLNLTAFGGANSTYRFTFFSHTERGATSQVMLIELVGPAVAAPAARTATAGPFTVSGTDFTLGSGWSDEQYGMLRQAISMLPAAALAEAAGLTFHRRAAGTGPEAGHYDQIRDTVVLFANAFPSDVSARLGQQQIGVRNILHEIGHALDLRPLNRAWSTFNRAGQSAPAARALLGARSLSGTRYQAPTTSGGNYDPVPAFNDQTGDFRQAVRSDGVRRDTSGRRTPEGTTAQLSGGVSTYSNTDYEEMFAESYALYIADPNTLRLLRPNTYNYFARRYPRP